MTIIAFFKSLWLYEDPRSKKAEFNFGGVRLTQFMFIWDTKVGISRVRIHVMTDLVTAQCKQIFSIRCCGHISYRLLWNLTTFIFQILRAVGNAYHPECFNCSSCEKNLDNIPFTLDATNQVHCVECYQM